MKNATDSLFQFLSKEEDKDRLAYNIDRLGLGLILLDKLKEINECIYKKYLLKKIAAKIKNQIIEEELLKLIIMCEKDNVKIVNIKGILLADDLYCPREYRQFSDIDILAKKEDFKIIIDHLYELQYVEEIPFYNKYDSKSIFEEEEPDLQHLIFNKHVILHGIEINICIELHLNLFDPSYVKINSRKVIDSAVTQVFNNKKLWVPCIQDRLIHLLIHYFKTLEIDFHNILHSDRYNIQIWRIHDIALLIDKYKQDISWNDIKKIIIKHNFVTEFLFLAYILNSIYHNRIPQNVIDEFSKYIEIKDKSIKFYMRKLMLINAYNFIFDRDICSIGKEIAFYNRIDGQEILCKYNNTTKKEKDYDIFIIDEFVENIQNRFGTYLSLGEKPNSSCDCSGEWGVWWDLSKLYIHIRVRDDKLVFSTDAGCVLWNRDSVEVVICYESRSSNINIKSFTIAPIINSTKIELCVEEITGNTILDTNDYFHKFDADHKGYEITVGIPWAILDIKPFRGLKMSFDVAINDCDNKTRGRKTRLSWSCNGGSWWDIRTFGQLILN